MAKLILLIIFICVPFFHAQVDPALMSTLSKLSPDQRQQLLKQHGEKAQGMPMQTPTANLPSREVVVETPDEDSFDDQIDMIELSAMATHQQRDRKISIIDPK